MSKLKKYFQKQFQISMFNLEHDDLSDFYLSSFQGSRSGLPLLCLRTLLFLGCVAIVLTSIIMTVQWISFGHWLTYLTHWGVVLIMITSGFAALVSLKAYLEDSIESSSSLLLFTKIYWVLYNITVPLAFMITIFYWSFLTQFEQDFAIDPILNVFIHGVNSVVMLVLVLFSRQPSRLLHFYHSILFCIVYLIFSVIYYAAGGLSPFGEVFIYPMLDWSKPGEAIITAVGTAVLLTIAHAFVVFLSLGRNKLGKRLFKNSSVDLYSY